MLRVTCMRCSFHELRPKQHFCMQCTGLVLSCMLDVQRPGGGHSVGGQGGRGDWPEAGRSHQPPCIRQATAGYRLAWLLDMVVLSLFVSAAAELSPFCMCVLQSPAASAATLPLTWAATSSTARMLWRAPSARSASGSRRALLRTSPSSTGSTSEQWGPDHVASSSRAICWCRVVQAGSEADGCPRCPLFRVCVIPCGNKAC